MITVCKHMKMKFIQDLKEKRPTAIDNECAPQYNQCKMNCWAKKQIFLLKIVTDINYWCIYMMKIASSTLEIKLIYMPNMTIHVHVVNCRWIKTSLKRQTIHTQLNLLKFISQNSLKSWLHNVNMSQIMYWTEIYFWPTTWHIFIHLIQTLL